jgi:iron complex outermembrane receptor protein
MLFQAVIGRAQQPARETSLDSLLNTRISSAAKYEQTITEVAGAVTIVTSEQIERYGYRTLSDVLAAARGFYVSDDRNYSYLGVRGFSRPTDYNNRILLLIDGYLTNEGVFGTAAVGTELGIDLAGLERIEIIRGPSSALYGTGAMFAIINLITREGKTVGGLRVSGRGGSYGRKGSSVLFGRRFGSGTDLMVSGTWDRATGQRLYYPEFDSPSTNHGIANGVDGESRWGVLARLQHGNVSIQARLSSRRKVIPTASYGTIFNNPGTWTVDHFSNVQIAYDKRFGGSTRLRTRVFGGQYRYQGDYLSVGSITQEGSLNQLVGSEAILQLDLSSANRLSVGGELKRNFKAEYYYPRSGPREYDLSLPYSVVSGYLQDEFQISRSLALLTGLRWDRYSHTGNSAAPRAAVIFTPTRSSTFKLLYGRAYRAASLVEGGTSFGSAELNPDLKAERLGTAELIYQQRLGQRVLLTGSLFDTRVSGLIDPVEDSQGNVSLLNVGKANTSGLELELDGRLRRDMSLYASYTRQRAVDGTGNRLTNSPGDLVKAGWSAQLTTGFQTAVELHYESGRRTLADTETDPFFLAHLNLIYSPRLNRRSSLARTLDHLDLMLRVNNLSGTRYAVPGGLEHVQPAIAQDGRNLLFELRARF